MKQQQLLKPGYRAQNGYIFTEYDCKEYNKVIHELNSWIASPMPIRDGLIDHSYVMFKTITGMK